MLIYIKPQCKLGGGGGGGGGGVKMKYLYEYRGKRMF